MFCPHLSFIIFLLFYTVFQFYSNYNSSKVRREHPTLHPVEKSIMEVEIMLSLITIDTENCKSDFPPYYLDTTLRMSKEEEEEVQLVQLH